MSELPFLVKAPFKVLNVGMLLITVLVFIVAGMPVTRNDFNGLTDSRHRVDLLSYPLPIKLQVNNSPAIDGAEKPELIPDVIAYGVLFRSLSVAPDADETERESTKSLAEHLASDKDQVPGLIETAEHFSEKVKALDLQVAEIKDKNWPNPSPEIMGRLTELQNSKEKIVEEAIELLPMKLGIKSAAIFKDKIEKGFKAKLKLFASPMSLSGHRHTSLYDVSPPIEPTVSRKTQRRVRVGMSIACYKFAFVDPSAPICVYTVTDACNCKCKSSEVRLDPKGENCSINRFLIDKVRWRQPEGEVVQCRDPGIATISPVACNDCFDIGTVQ